MTLLLLHGPAINSSRIKLTDLKKGFDSQDITVFEQGFDISEALGSLLTLPLLSDQRLIVLENPPEDFTFDSFDFSDSLTLLLWFDHEVKEKKIVLEWARENGQILYFPEGREVSVFPFLDCLINKDNKAFLELEKLKKGGYEIFYLITMTFYLLRNLVATPKSAPLFVRQKLEKQRKSFNLERVKSLYKNILVLEFKLKSGLIDIAQAEFSLVNFFRD